MNKMIEKRDYRIPLSEEQIKKVRHLYRNRVLMGCSFEGLCVYKTRHLNPKGLDICIGSDMNVRNFGCNHKGPD
jgi:hypothetical protein